jgi:hypothetical protein
MKIIIPHIILITATLLPFTITIINALYVNIGLNTVLNGPNSVKFNQHEKVRLRIHLFAALHLVGFYFLTNYYLELGNAKTYAFLIFSAASGLVLLGSFSKKFKLKHEHGNNSSFKEDINNNREENLKSISELISHIRNPSNWKVAKNSFEYTLDNSNLGRGIVEESTFEDITIKEKESTDLQKKQLEDCSKFAIREMDFRFSFKDLNNTRGEGDGSINHNKSNDKSINDLNRTQIVKFLSPKNIDNLSKESKSVKLDYTIHSIFQENSKLFGNSIFRMGFIPKESVDNMVTLLKTGNTPEKIIFRTEGIFQNKNKNSLPLNFLAFLNLLMKDDLVGQYCKAEKPEGYIGFCKDLHTETLEFISSNFKLGQNAKDVFKGYFITKRKEELYDRTEEIRTLINIKGKDSQ